MAGWTQADLDAIDAAISAGVLIVSFDGPPKRTIQYQQLSEMRKLRAEIYKCVNPSTSPTTRKVKWRKGFR